MDQQQRCDRKRDQRRIDRPGVRHEHSERCEHEIGRQALEREQARLAERMPPREPQHDREDRVIEQHEDGRCRETRCRKPELVVPDEPVRPQQDVRDGRCGEEVDQVVAGVESLDVPRVAHLDPLGQVLRDHDERQQPGGQEQHGRDEDDEGRVVRLVARRDNGEEVRQRGADRDQDERNPLARLERRNVRKGGPAERHRDSPDQHQERPGGAGETVLAAGRVRRDLEGMDFRSHSPLFL